MYSTRFVGCITSFFLLSTCFFPKIANSALVGYWNFDEGRGTIVNDLSGTNNHGSIYGNPTWVSGKIGTALSFDGIDDYVQIAHSISLNIRDQITISLWINIPNQTNDGFPISKSYDIGPWEMRIFNGQPNFYFNVSGNWYTAIGSPNFTTNIWHHFIGWYDGTRAKVFVDGVDITTNIWKMSTGTLARDYPITGTLSLNTEPVRIGRRGSTSGAGFYRGLVDEIKVYNHALTPAEIQNEYTSGLQTGTLTGRTTRANDGTGIDAKLEILRNNILVYQLNTQITGNYIVSLPAGTYEVRASKTGLKTETITNVNVTTNQNISLDLALTQAIGPEITVNKTDLSFTATKGINPSPQTFTITNSGTVASVLKWSLTTNPTVGWINFNPTNGSLPRDGTQTNVNVSLNITGLNPGIYSTNIVITDPNATNSPQSIPVTLSITEQNSSGITDKIQGEYKTILGNNLFNPKLNESCRIEFNVPTNGMVTLKILDLTGRVIKVILNETRSPGTYTLNWDGKNSINEWSAPGIYLLNYQFPGGTETRKIFVSK